MKIKLLNKPSDIGLKEFTDDYQYGDDLTDEDAILVRSAVLHDYDFPVNLKAIARAGAGVNNIPLQRCSEEGIVVFNTPGANANAGKELTIAGLMLASRKIVEAADWVKTLPEADFSKAVEKGKSAFAGPEIAGKKLGVIGLGAIGVGVANTAVHLGMEVLGYDPYISVSSAWSLSKWVKHCTDLNELIRKCDYLTLHVPATKETTGLINSQSLAEMKDGVRILNFARGDLVVNDDLIEALNSGKVAAYITDFGTPQLCLLKNVTVLPHLGASTPESEDNCALMAVHQLRNYLETGNIINSVNMPNVNESFNSRYRLCIIHRNVPNMLAQFASIIASNSINIENMTNKARGDYAYTLIDTDVEVDPASFEHLDNVIKVRLIVSRETII